MFDLILVLIVQAAEPAIDKCIKLMKSTVIFKPEILDGP